MVHQLLKPPLRQTLEAYPGLTPARSSTPLSYQILENTMHSDRTFCSGIELIQVKQHVIQVQKRTFDLKFLDNVHLDAAR